MENNGDKTYYDKIFERELLIHADALNTFAYHLTYNDADASDLVQETFLKAYKSIESYHVGTNAKAWLFKILKNAFINEYRKKAKRPHMVDYDGLVNINEEENGTNYSSYTDLRKEIYENMMGDEVTNALNSLDERFRAVLLLSDVEDFKYDEIAAIMDIKVGTVRSRLHRARNMLKEKLKEYGESQGFEDKRK